MNHEPLQGNYVTICYLGLGSNLKYPRRQLQQAFKALGKLPRSTIIQKSNLYLSLPMGPRAQPSYINAVIKIKTSLSPKNLLYFCQTIETQHQRFRKKHWGARTLDIDILLYGKLQQCTANLTIPHPYLTQRDFVLIPLLEISPHLRLPNGEFLTSYLNHCNTYIKS